MTVYESLAVCQAAHRLGMMKYTGHIFRKMDAYLSNSIPGYDEIDAVLHFSATHWRLHKNMVFKLMVTVREEKIPDPEVFAEYCHSRTALQVAIMETMEWHAAQLEKARHAAADRARWQEIQARREQERLHFQQKKARMDEIFAQRQQTVRERQAKENKRSTERTAHEVAMRQACLAKTRASGRRWVMTAEEKKWYVKEFGKQPPRGC